MRGYTTISRDRAKALRKTSTDAERRMWLLLRDRRLLPFKFRRQHPIGPYIADFVCIEKRLVVELDGGQHADAVEYDERRTAEIQERGYRVIRFWDNDVLQRTESVMQALYRELGRPSP